MKVTQMALYRTLQTNLGRNSSTLNDLYIQASTGERMSEASDDPSAIGSVFSSRTAITKSDRHLETASSTQDNFDILDGYLDSAETIMVRAKEIATAAINGTLTEQDYQTYSEEVVELREALLDIANSKVDSKYIFAGYADQTEPFSGTPITYNGTSDHKMVEVSAGLTVQTNLTGDEVFTSPSDCFSILDDLETALDNSDATGLETALTDLETAANQIRGKRSEIGNINSRLDDISNLLENLKLQMEGRLSNYQDTDLVEVMSDITQTELAYEMALSVSTRLSNLKITDYL